MSLFLLLRVQRLNAVVVDAQPAMRPATAHPSVAINVEPHQEVESCSDLLIQKLKLKKPCYRQFRAHASAGDAPEERHLGLAPGWGAAQ